jgi:hypothetical protein
VAVSETLQARQAALLLHGLPASVRTQVLSRLSAAESSRLKPLLDELAALGIPKTKGSLVESLGSALRAPATVVERAERLHPDEVLRGLENCAPATVAVLLRAAEWPWKSEVVSRMSHTLREKVMAGGDAQRVLLSPAVLRVLCECLCRDAAGPAVRRQPFGESLGARVESVRVDVNRLGTSPWPAGKRRNGAGAGSGIALGVGAFLRGLFGWNH